MIKKYKPKTAGRRQMSGTDFSSLTKKKKPERKFLKSLSKNSGRASSGRISVRHKGGRVKRKFRVIDFGQEYLGKSFKVVSLEYDPNRTSFIALLETEDEEKKYILAPHGLKEGDEIKVDEKTSIKKGNRLKLKNIPIGTEVHNIELEPEMGGKIVRGAGSSAQVLAQEKKYTQLKMPSTEIRRVNKECFASIGIVSNPEHRFVKIGKAGRNRLKGKRPAVRGVAMNPIDHPHGGGEGRGYVGIKHTKTPTGKIARGVKTRKKKKSDKLIIKRRKKN